MKKIPKKPFEELVEITRTYWQEDFTPMVTSALMKSRIEKAKELAKATGVDWMAFTDLIDALIKPEGFNPDAELDEIYCVLRVSGWEVVDA